MLYKKLFLFSFILIAIVACKNTSEPTENIVAEVDGNKLYKVDVSKATPLNISTEDSISFVKDYIEKWIKHKLLLKKANINLASEIIDIDKQVEDYKNSLLIYNYQRKLLREKLDTSISEKELKDYYNKTIGEYKLDFNIIKAIYFKIPRTVKNQAPVRTWYWTNKDKYLNDLEIFCKENNGEYILANKWISFDEFQKKIPKKIDNQKAFLMYSNAMYAEDSVYNYFVRIKEYKLINDTTPLSFVKNKVSAIIMNNRKMDFLRDIENSIFEKSRNEFTIY